MTIDVSTDARSSEEIHVVGASEQADVIDLRDAWREELDRAGNQVLISTASERIEESRVHLIKVKVIRSCTRGSPTLSLAAGMNGFDKLIDFVRRKESRLALRASSDINDADAVVGIEHGDRNCAGEWLASAREVWHRL